MKNTRLLLYLLAILIEFSSCKVKDIQIFVSPTGKIENQGTNEAPLSNIQSAVEKAKEIRQSNGESHITIVLLPGEYHLESPITITPGLSDMTLKGSDPSKVSIKGSRPLSLNWRKYNENIFVTPLEGDLDFDQFAVNGKLQILARYPNYNESGGHWQGHAPDAFSNERMQSWENPAGTIIHAMHSAEWGDFHYVITGIDEKGGPSLDGGHQNNRPAPPHPDYRMVENVFEELDSPGEWYLDKEKGLIYYWPDENTNLQTANYEGVILKNLITLKGSESSPVKNVSISGIKFEYAQRTFRESYEPLLRSDWTIYRGGAVFIEGTEQCSIEYCEFTNLGGNAIFVSSYNNGVKLSGNHIHECGASGICFVGNPDAVRSPSYQYQEFVPQKKMDTQKGPKNELYPRDCMADNNLIYRTGRIEKQTAGVQIAMAMKIRVSNNSIYDVPRAGINIGDGTWGGHIIEFNDVFNTVLESGDHGSFNSWGRDRFWHPNRNRMDEMTEENPEMPRWDALYTTIIRNNRFRCDHGWDIDLDDGSSNYHLYNNLCLNGGIKLREGFYRIVENNIMVNNGFHPHVWFKNSGDIFKRNIVFIGHKDIRLDGWGQEVDYNLFVDQDGLQKVKENGTDANSSYGDPIFSDPSTMDFTVMDNSPAFNLGFINFPMDRFGVKEARLKKLAKTPDVPVLVMLSRNYSSENKVVEWLGAQLKNIETKEEKSASGLSEVAGTIIVQIENGSIAEREGLLAGDVIIKAEETQIKTNTDLLKVYQEIAWTAKINLVVFRNQSEKAIKVKIK